MRFESEFINELLIGNASDKLDSDLLQDEKVALHSKKQSITYNELQSLIDETATRMKELGIGKGMIVAISKELMPPEYIIELLAIVEAGATPCVQDDINILEANEILQVCLLKHIDKERQVQASYVPSIHAYVNIYNRNNCKRIEPRSILLTSSGSTSQPKIIIQSLTGVLANIKSNAVAMSISAKEKSLCILPVYYSYGLIAQVLCHLYCHGTLIFESSNSLVFSAKKILDDHKITNIFFVPSLLRQVLLFSKRHMISALQHPLNFISVGGEFVDCRTVEEAISFFDCTLIKTYGLAEAGPRVSTKVITRKDIISANNVGVPLSTTAVEILDENKEPVTDQTIGTIAIRSVSVCLGYTGEINRDINPKTKIITKDIGFLKEGELYLLGRKGAFVNWFGQRIWFTQILEILYSTLCFYKIELSKKMEKLIIAIYPIVTSTLTNNDIKALLEKHLKINICENDIEIVRSSCSRTFK